MSTTESMEDAMEDEVEFLTADELRRKLKIKTPTVRAWTYAGMTCHPVGRLRRYILAEVLEWLRAREAQRVEKKNSAKEANI